VHIDWGQVSQTPPGQSLVNLCWYRGVTEVRGTKIHSPNPFAKTLTDTQKRKLKYGFARRAAIEPKLGHLKSDHLLSKTFYKGIVGDNINVMLTAAAVNFKLMMNKCKYFLLCLWKCLTNVWYHRLGLLKT
jgi:hypothetical protein